MTHYRQWSAAFASYFTFMGLWTAFGPSTLMASSPQAAPLALACITLAYFVATPFVRLLWMRLGFARTVVLMGGGVCLALCTAAVAPQWLAWCVPLAFFFGSGSYTLCETKMLEDLAQAGQGHAFGRARKWGSFGFLAAAAVGGAVFSLGGVGRAFTLALGLCGLAYLACCIALARASHAATEGTRGTQGMANAAPALRDDPAGQSLSTPALHLGTPDSAAQTSTSTSTGQRWPGAAAVSGMRLAEAISTTWFGAWWLSTGHGPLQTGLLCALPVAAEFLALWQGGRILARYSAPALMLACCAVSAARWLATPFCTELWCAVPLQSLHAFSFGFFYPASLIWLKHSYGDGFFHARYATEAAARALTAAASFAAASWVIATLGYGAIYAASTLLAVLSGLWWWRVWRI
ncbi:hypothetical protein DIC66_17155 [Rhodoferax lacus]|uniref:Major facilitator superfamily associated domain-containing protein n=1 Tax=Rhodoferax lacus TaxID=2184758 RepID=A0A3E1R926_9BURK|nr:MFS transporter [Rhodoferax lacus]RFO95721.1 hypothetical protein DIC66_17155 [Rhodoferax lacus]